MHTPAQQHLHANRHMKLSFSSVAVFGGAVLASFVVGFSHGWVTPQLQPSAGAARARRSEKLALSSTGTAGTTTLDGEPIRGPITPLGNFVLVKTKETLSATAGGILLPDQAKERPTEGQVIAAGPGKLHPHTGIRIPNPVSVGNSVLYGKFDGVSLLYNDDQCQMIRDDDVLLYYDGLTATLDNVRPCRDYVLVEPKKDASETSSGIVVAAAVMSSNLPCEGRVIRVGEGRMSSGGTLTAPPVAEGDMVKFKDYAGNDVTIENKAYTLVRMVDILARVKKE